MLTQQVALLNQVPQGAYVVSIVSGSPAEKAGVAVGDIIYKIDGNSLNSTSTSLGDLVSGKKPGDTLTLEIWRNSASKEIKVTLTESPQ